MNFEGTRMGHPFQIKGRLWFGLAGLAGLVRSYPLAECLPSDLSFINLSSTATFSVINSHTLFDSNSVSIYLPLPLISLFFLWFFHSPELGWFRRPWAADRHIWSSFWRRLVCTTALFWEPFFLTLFWTHFLIFFKHGLETALVDS